MREAIELRALRGPRRLELLQQHRVSVRAARGRLRSRFALRKSSHLRARSGACGARTPSAPSPGDARARIANDLWSRQRVPECLAFLNLTCTQALRLAVRKYKRRGGEQASMVRNRAPPDERFR